ncbi:MAG: hypothetical protein HC836_37995 [Richelia sp. RM2_1_2]|nr:hypothetical protein [Richelia sp. RM2_1_2]
MIIKTRKVLFTFEKFVPQICIPAKSTRIIHPMELVIKNETSNCRLIYPITISNYIRFFSILPDLVLECSGIKITEKDDSGLIEMLITYREIYKGITLWMTRKHDGIIDDRIYSSPFKHYEKFAIQRLELLKLIQALFDKKYSYLISNSLKSVVDNSTTFNAGEEGLIWFSCEFFDLKAHFEQNGLLGKATKEGMRSTTDQIIKGYSQQINEYHLTKIIENQIKITDENAHQVGSEMIEALAQIVSQSDWQFYEKYYLEYCKSIKRITREIRNAGVGTCFFLDDDGKVKDIKRGKRKKR